MQKRFSKNWGIFTKGQAGFSLVETLVTVMIMTMIMTICVLLLLTSSDSFQVTSAQVQLISNERLAMEWIKRDLQQSKASVITGVPADGNAYTTIIFQVPANTSGGTVNWNPDTIQYTLQNTNELHRLQGASNRLIARGISALTFTRQATAPDVVEVSLSGEQTTDRGRTITGILNFNVKVRN